jgi:methionyl-tRNA synthetase
MVILFQDRAATVVSLCVNLACLLAVLAEPFLPALSATLLEQLNTTKNDVNVLLAGGKHKPVPNVIKLFWP